jgi:hypothetical protein
LTPGGCNGGSNEKKTPQKSTTQLAILIERDKS